MTTSSAALSSDLISVLLLGDGSRLTSSATEDVRRSLRARSEHSSLVGCSVGVGRFKLFGGRGFCAKSSPMSFMIPCACNRPVKANETTI